MKAWHVFDGEPYETSLLVFAASRNRARLLAYRLGPWDYEDWVYLRARRATKWDVFADSERVIETNEELPPEAPRFYWEEGDDGEL